MRLSSRSSAESISSSDSYSYSSDPESDSSSTSVYVLKRLSDLDWAPSSIRVFGQHAP